LTLNRRQFGGGLALGTLGFLVGCERRQLTPQQARQQSVPFETLTAAEAGCLASLGECLVPGARECGVAHFVDQQLAAPEASVLLMIRYFPIPKPFAAFYRAGLAGTEAASRRRYGKNFGSLTPELQSSFIYDLSTDKLTGWEGPPQSIFYFIVRNDAVDVVYGTVDGFKLLGIPYMPHILPPSFV
jgi:Gluconate 2-dehydrogenase subunit 3